jgi:plasmid stabilization system protein ParE
MRSYSFAPHAEHDLQSQIDYLSDQGAHAAADRLLMRVQDFIAQFLTQHPKAGVFLAHRDLWETWVPRTRLVLWYRFTDDALQIVRIWHVAQNRASSEG